MNWYVLFSKTGYEQKLSDEIERAWHIDGIKPFIPMFDARFRRQGTVTTKRCKLFPGYVFIESEKSGTEFWLAAKGFIYKSNYALKLLNYGDYDNGISTAINKNEQQTLMKLFDKGDYCVSMSTGLSEGGKIKVTHGPLQNHESIIKKIKWRSMEAVIEIELFGALREVTVGFQSIKRI